MRLVSTTDSWNFQIAANTVPADPFTEVPPVAGYTLGAGPFGDGVLNTSADEAPNTLWPVNTGLWLQRVVALTNEQNLVISGQIRQTMFVYWDGVYIGAINSGFVNTNQYNQYKIIIPGSNTSIGNHVLSILCLSDTDVNDASHVSLQIDTLPPAFAYQPEAPMVENVAFLTDISITHNGSESALKTTGLPKRKINLRYPANFQSKVPQSHLLKAGAREGVLLPRWVDAVQVGVVPVNQYTILLTTAGLNFKDYAILWESDDNFQILPVDTVFSNAVTFGNLTRAFSNPWLIPLSSAFCETGFKRNTNGYNSNFVAQFTLLDHWVSTTVAPTQYLGDDVFLDFEFKTTDGISKESVSVNIDVFDSVTGPVAFSSSWFNPRTLRNMYFLNSTRAEYETMMNFLYRRKGRYTSFWQPSYETDMKADSINPATITTDIIVKKEGMLIPTDRRSHLAIETNDGSWTFVEIVDFDQSTVVDDTTVKLIFSSGISVATGEIKRLSWLGRRRLDSDSITIRHETGGITTCSFVTVEIET